MQNANNLLCPQEVKPQRKCYYRSWSCQFNNNNNNNNNIIIIIIIIIIINFIIVIIILLYMYSFKI